uniref:Uncharacterized protein n=1 Tax=Kalanchoe fedtschenkoi TaxID=63787 RepID=A0A7N0RFJ9_KALFE
MMKFHPTLLPCYSTLLPISLAFGFLLLSHVSEEEVEDEDGVLGFLKLVVVNQSCLICLLFCSALVIIMTRRRWWSYVFARMLLLSVLGRAQKLASLSHGLTLQMGHQRCMKLLKQL